MKLKRLLILQILLCIILCTYEAGKNHLLSKHKLNYLEKPNTTKTKASALNQISFTQYSFDF